MITDCGSFIGEYLPSLNPCIYIFNPRKKHQWDAYTPLAKKILNTYYIANDVCELEQYFQDVVVNDNDIKKESRINLKQAQYGNIGHAAQYICDYLERELVD